MADTSLIRVYRVFGSLFSIRPKEVNCVLSINASTNPLGEERKMYTYYRSREKIALISLSSVQYKRGVNLRPANATSLISHLAIIPTLETSKTQPTPIIYVDNLALVVSLGSGIHPYRYLILFGTRILKERDMAQLFPNYITQEYAGV